MKKTNGNIESPALGCKLGRAYQILLSQLDKALKKAGLDLTTSEYLVMRAVYRLPGAQQCEIADLVGKDKGAVCRCVAGLQKKGLISTEAVSYKCLKVYPSDKGLELQPAVMEVAAARYKALAELTSPESLDILTRLLDDIINSK